MQARSKVLHGKLDDPQLYARDLATFDAVTAELAQLQHDIAAAEERWLVLELEREALGES
jgi:ATP-binding cassette subfamily F protein uup